MRRDWWRMCAVLALVIAAAPAWATAPSTDGTTYRHAVQHGSLGASAGLTGRSGFATERTPQTGVAESTGDKPIWEQLLTSTLAAALVAGVASFFVSWWKAKREIRAAGISADAVRDAGLKHAIETEALKLRYAIGRRHIDTFYSMAGPLRAILMDLPNADEAKVKSFHNNMYPDVPLTVALYAELATPLELYQKAYPIEKTFIDAVHALMKRLITADPNPDARPRPEAEEIVDLSIVSVTALIFLMRVVDLSTEIRIASSRDVTAEFDAMLDRWKETRQKLPIVPPDSTGIAGTGP